MTLIPAGHAQCRAVFDSEGPSDPVMVVTGHVRPSGLTAGVIASTVANSLWGGPGSLLSMMADSFTLIRVDCDMNPGTGDIEQGQWNGSLSGGLGGTAVPPQVAVLIKKVSSLAGRRNRGRMYVPGLEGASCGPDGIVNPTPLGNWQAAADAWLAASVTNGVDAVILHETPPDTATPILSLEVQATVATQRRRVR